MQSLLKPVILSLAISSMTFVWGANAQLIFDLNMANGNAVISDPYSFQIQNYGSNDIIFTGGVAMDNATDTDTILDVTYDPNGGTNYTSTWVSGFAVNNATDGMNSYDLGSTVTIPSMSIVSFQIDVTSGSNLESKFDNSAVNAFGSGIVSSDNLLEFANASQQRVGFGEIEYQVVPEPATTSLLFGCLGLGLMMRRRRH